MLTIKKILALAVGLAFALAGVASAQIATGNLYGTAHDESGAVLPGVTVTLSGETGTRSTVSTPNGAFRFLGLTRGDYTVTLSLAGFASTSRQVRITTGENGRFMIAHDDLSFGNVPSSLDNDPRLENADGTRRDKANHIQQISDYGFDLGGPIIKDKLWFYGTYGKQDIRLITLTGVNDKTLLPSYNFKLNWQASSKTMVSAFYFLGSKQKFGRDPGFGVAPTQSFSWLQDNEFTEGGIPGGFWKLQIDQTVSPNFFVSAKGSYYDTGFSLSPTGGLGDSWTLDYVRGEGIGSSPKYLAVRPQKNITVDANYFFEGLGGSNELKFGFSWRNYKTTSGYQLGGNQLQGYLESDEGCAGGAPHCGTVELGRSEPYEYTGKYWTAYLGDVLTMDRLTINLGVRWDLQSARNSAATVSANSSFPNVMPDLVYEGNDFDALDWNTWSPRVGFSYALNDSRRTILRANYALYGGLLSFGDVSEINPISWGAKAYEWNDLNGDRFAQPNEVNLNNFLYSYGVNLSNPGSASPSNRIDQDYKSSKLNEFVVGLDHELTPGLAVGIAYTYRHGSDYAQRLRLGGACDLETASVGSCRTLGPGDYAANAPVTANGFTANTYSPNSALVAAGSGGRIRTNRDGYSTSFSGLEFTLTKRLSNRWMTRVAFSWNDWTESFDGTPTTFAGNPGRTETDPLVDGGQVALLSGGSGKASFYSSSKWQVYANGLYQLGAGFDLSASLFGRQGGAYPIDIRTSAGQDGTLNAIATPEVDTNRYSDIWNLDLRLAKTFRFGRDLGLTLSAEWFNVFNTSYVLSRYRYSNSSSFTNTSQGAEPGLGRIEEIIAPGIFRIGARLSF